MGYTSIPEAFVDAIAAWEFQAHGYAPEKEWIDYAPGVITSINQAYLTFTEPGDKIIVQPPVYDHFRLYIERLGRVAVDNPLILENDRYRMDFEGLERLIDEKTKVLVLCNPHNPIGLLWDRETLKQLAEICERHGILVISDEIHGDLALYGCRHTPFCSISEAAARVGLIFAGPTKAFNLAGLSGTAFCIIPDRDKREKYLATLRNAKLDEASIPSIEAVIAAYREDTAWLDCRALGLPQDELMDYFRTKAKVIPSNGASYGSGGEGFLRLNIDCPASVLDEALNRIGKAFGR